MSQALKRFAGILLVVVLIVACRKDRAAAIPFNDRIETEFPVLIPVRERFNEVIGGYYKILPFNYNQTTKSYPLIVFLPGAGQFGNGSLDLPFVLNDGIAQMASEKKFPPNFKVNGQNFSFIVLSPQFSRYPSNSEVYSFIAFAKQAFRVDTSRIYLAGLSMGGFVTTDVGAEYAPSIAAIVPISGALSSGDIDAKCKRIASSNLPVWVFHNTEDPSINVAGPQFFVSLITQHQTSILPKLTLFPAFGHDAWTRALDPGYREGGLNVYEWMLQYTR